MSLPVTIEISGSEGCIEVRCAVKYSQSFLASCCTFIWQLAVLLFYNTQVRSEHAEVSSSRSTEETYESRKRKGLDGWDKTDAIYLILKDSSCSKEVTYLRVSWKLRVKNKNA
ncbi:MAG: hypothetical protein ACOYIG_11930 [Acetivibrionales bacterium]|jgi:hypothetical protein